ncbi:glycosyltransferase family 2 protein [Acuticoccus mangrovi]|uniref:Glycosyltransferase family 2 protein n=1 Tax=Acuticoccus mangrovi TaxID=2796142 RepID=A0A934MGL1_9HYPH|nr:glycosyltransferase family 2 protein [Acuticoccus mangrovi]MBJ3775106.1 glycosyltransferase family 2 protein [Acuticoccus mangrovi]
MARSSPDAAAALAAFGGTARLDGAVVADGEVLDFAPRAGFVVVRVALAPGCWRLRLTLADPAALRVDALTGDGPIPLPVPAVAKVVEARFALSAPLDAIRLAPVKAARLKIVAFSVEPAPAWASLLPDWRMGPVALPPRQAGEASPETEVAGRRPPGWDEAITIDAVEAVRIAGTRFEVEEAGAVRLAFAPPLRPGLWSFAVKALTEDGAPALVEPRILAQGAASPLDTAAILRPVAGALHRGVVRLDRPTPVVVLRPRTQSGVVDLRELRVRRLSPWGRIRLVVRLAGEAVGRRLLMATSRLATSRGGGLEAVARLATPADRRHRRGRGEERAALARWLARPVMREGPVRVATSGTVPLPAGAVAADAAPADVTLRPGERLTEPAVEAIRRAPPGPVSADAAWRVLGLSSSPERFAAPDPIRQRAGGGPLPLAADGAAGGTHIPFVLVERRGGVSVAAPAVRPSTARPPVSLITPTRDAPHHLARFLATLFAPSADPPELILVDNGSRDARALRLLEEAAARPEVTLIRDDRPFNFAALSNLGAAAARGDILIFANNDIAFTDPAAIDRLAVAAARPQVGVAGARLLYPDGRVQHAGLVLAGEARVRHLERFLSGRAGGYMGRQRIATSVSAVTGALMALRAELFFALGGFDAARYPVLYNDIDLCLRVRERGLANCLVPSATAVHHESVSIGQQPSDALFSRGGAIWRWARAVEAERFRMDWGPVLDLDPCYPSAFDPLEAAFVTRR